MWYYLVEERFHFNVLNQRRSEPTWYSPKMCVWFWLMKAHVYRIQNLFWYLWSGFHLIQWSLTKVYDFIYIFVITCQSLLASNGIAVCSHANSRFAHLLRIKVQVFDCIFGGADFMYWHCFCTQSCKEFISIPNLPQLKLQSIRCKQYKFKRACDAWKTLFN